MPTQAPEMLRDVAARIRELKDISGYTTADLARMTGFSEADCAWYETGSVEMPFSFVHKCAAAFGVDIVDLIEGTSPACPITPLPVTGKAKWSRTLRVSRC
jgi:acetyl-CoA synthetase